MIMAYTPHDWFWIVGGDESRAWSSAVGGYVAGYPTDRLTRIASEAELNDVLKPYGLALPLVEVPKSVSPYQARVALHAAGLLPAVQAAISAAPVPAQLAWEYATVFERHSPFIEALAPMLGLNDAQIDGLFIAAGQV